ncbi:transcription factor bHLH149-like [Miscanthus floridulus]|uniref:transcription factor bHLH149-like n=1 Tax=Miscanthus floridulus TaxID=154761 RepID=UPI003459105B
MPSSSSSSSSSADDEGARGKCKRGSPGACASASGGDYHQGPSSKWRTPRAQQAYSSKLLQALRLVRGGGGTGTLITCSASAPAVRDAAYRALAVAARGRSHWSRAILASSRRCRAPHCLRARRPPPPRPRQRQQQQQGGETEERRPGGLAGRAKVLGRLVPGCRSLSLPALLAEVSDYIAALEMQVRAMGQLTHDLAASASASSSSAPTAAPSIAPP